MSKMKKFGTFGGVFTPSILTILGVIMYLRFPTIIGQAGLINTIGIIVIAHIISITTSLSVASLSTDKQVKTGGTYFMISRSLGLPIGGTLGLALFVGLSFSVSLYLIGFAESFLAYWGLDASINSIRLCGTIILIVVTTITFISTSLAIKSQYFIMAAIVLSLLSIFLGSHEFAPKEIQWGPMADAAPFMLLFGIFFPAVTGFEAGVSMSGDLKNAKKSLPVGAISAVLVGFVVYIGLAFFYTYTVDAEALRNDPNILFEISLVPALVIAGIWGATLSSALGSILGAPRILQAIAMDKIAPKFFAKGTGKTNEPRNALLLAFLIAEAGILIGQLDVIARIVSMFFITTYAFLNLASAIESWSSSDFRPAFKIPRFVSILGATSAFFVMVLLDFAALAGAVVALGILYFFLRRKQLNLESGDAWSSFWTNLAKTSLLKLANQKLLNRNWRPNIIMFSGGHNARPHLIELGLAISGKLGAITDFELVVNDSVSEVISVHKAEAKENIFSRIYNCNSIQDGIRTITGVYGFSGFEPNTVLMGWSKDQLNAAFLANLLSDFRKKNLNALFLDYDEKRGFGNKEKIDIWWNGKGRHLSLSLNLVKFIVSENSWRDAAVRILIISEDNKISDKLYKSASLLLDELRIKGEVKVIENENRIRTNEMIIGSESSETDLVILGISQKNKEYTEAFIQKINTVSEIENSLLMVAPSDEFEEINAIPNTVKPSFQLDSNDTVNEHFELPIIEDSLLSERAKKLHLDYSALTQELHKNTFMYVLSRKLEIIDNFSALVEKTFERLEQTLTKEGKSEREIAKLNQAFLASCVVFVDTNFSTSYEEISAQIDTGIVSYQSKSDEFISTTQERISYTVSGTDKELSVRLRRLVEDSVSSALNDQVYKKFTTLLANEYTYFELIKNVIQDINTLYDLGNVDKRKAASTIQSKKTDITATLALITTDLKQSDSRFKSELQQAVNGQVELIIHKILNNNRGKGLYAKNSKKSKSNYESLFTDFTGIWQERTSTLKNALYLDCLILNGQKRIGGIIKKSNSKITELVKERVIAALDRQISTLENYSHEKEVKAAKNISQTEFDIVEIFQEAYYKVLEFIEQFPEEMELQQQLPQEDDNALISAIQIETVEPNKLIKHYVDTVFYEPYYRLLEESQLIFRKISIDCKETSGMLSFRIGNRHSDDEASLLEISGEQKLFSEIKRQVLKDRNRAIQLLERLDKDADAMIKNATAPLSSYSIIKAEEGISTQVRGHKNKKINDTISNTLLRIRTNVSDKLVSLMYRASDGVIFAKKIIKQEQALETKPEAILNLLDTKRLSEKELSKIPVFYRTLFQNRSFINDDYWVPREEEMKIIKRAYKRHKEGVIGGVMIIGVHGAGKSTLAKYAVSKMFKRENIFTVNPPLEGSVNLENWRAELAKSTTIDGDLTQIYSSIPPNSALIINDLELWWERTEQGNEILKELINMINNYSHNFLVVVNCNSFSFKQINKTFPIDHYFQANITCSPFDSNALEELILKRHKSSGLEFYYKNRHEESVSKLQLASLFNSYFSTTDGIPGVALNTWLANIQGVDSSKFKIRKPSTGKIEVLETLDKDWLVLIALFVHHKNLTPQKLGRLLAIEYSEAELFIKKLHHSGVITNRAGEVYELEKHLEPYLVNLCEINELI